MSAPLLKVENLSYRYQSSEPWVLKDICFEVQPKESLGIIGPNGGGKTTLLNLLLGLLTPDQGQVVNAELPSSSESFFGYVPQFTILNPHLPMQVQDLILTGPQLKKTNEKRERAQDLLNQIELYDKRKHLVSSLSGGQRQKLLLARALMNRPCLLVLDEPTTGLDSIGCDQFLKLLEQVKEQQGTAVIMVDHNLNQILSHCDKILCLNKTHHWHDQKEMFNQDILESIYHCEFEHTRIHEEKGLSHQHEHCDHPHPKKHEH